MLVPINEPVDNLRENRRQLEEEEFFKIFDSLLSSCELSPTFYPLLNSACTMLELTVFQRQRATMTCPVPYNFKLKTLSKEAMNFSAECCV